MTVLSAAEDAVLRAVIAIEADSGYSPSLAEVVYYVGVQGGAPDADTVGDALNQLVANGCVSHLLESGGRKVYAATAQGRSRIGNCS